MREGTLVWVHFEGPDRDHILGYYGMALSRLIPEPRVPAEYTLEDWHPSIHPGSLDLTVTNHGGPIDAQKIQDYLQKNLAPSGTIAVTAKVFGTAPLPELIPAA